MKYINKQASLYQIVTDYPEIKDYLIANGLTQVEDERRLETMGKQLSLDMIIKSKQLHSELFIRQLDEIIDQTRNSADTTLFEKPQNPQATIRIQGILPCPIRIPLLEHFESWLARRPQLRQSLDYELKAASLGVEWIKQAIEQNHTADGIADLFLSAGFDLFFDKRYIGRLKQDKVFRDLTGLEKYHSDFDNAEIDMKDPERDYSMIGVVPAVFLINQQALGGRKMPHSWEELINGDYQNMVSLPIADFDLFNAILLNIYRKYGDEGVGKLGKTLLRSMHPAQMVKSDTGQNQPAITIMPYFFTKMVRNTSNMIAVWPEDGAIVSPIFMLSKADKADQLKPIVDFFASAEVGQILSHQGRFPSTHPDVDNQISKQKKYMWVGWDFIAQHDIGQLLSHCIQVFERAGK